MPLKRPWARCMCHCRSITPSAIVSSSRRFNASFVCGPISFCDGSYCDIDVDRVRALAHSRRLTRTLPPANQEKMEGPEHVIFRQWEPQLLINPQSQVASG